MLPTHWFYINTSCKDIPSVGLHTGTKIIDKMLPLLFFVTSALSSIMAASYHQENLQSMNDAPATISDRFYYMPSRGDQSSTIWDDESQRNLALIDRLEKQTKRVHTGEQMSLSIMNPLDVLRQKLLLELSNRQFRQKQNQIRANYDYLRQIG